MGAVPTLRFGRWSTVGVMSASGRGGRLLFVIYGLTGTGLRDNVRKAELICMSAEPAAQRMFGMCDSRCKVRFGRCVHGWG